MADLKQQYFWVEFEEIGGLITGLKNDYTEMYYSFDGSTWRTAYSSLSMGSNKLVYFKNETKKLGNFYESVTLTILFNSRAKVGGDISSITDMVYGACDKLFYENEYLTDASELILPWDTLMADCYSDMFYGCTSLTTAPELPATTLANSCYSGMFRGCTSLTTAPELPATTLANDCYRYMFYGCTSLTTAPALPVTTLAKGCYLGMFKNCTSLTTAPALPATILVENCYFNMFDECVSLNYIKMLATDITAANCLFFWVDDVAPTGTFVKAAENTTIPVDSANGIPIGWTVYNEGDPNIPDPDNPGGGGGEDPDNPGGGGGEDPDNPGGGGSSGDTSGDTTNYILVEPTSFNSTSASTSTQVRVEFTNSDGNGLTINNTLSWVTLEYAIGGFLDDITEEVNYNIYVRENTGGTRQGTITFGYTDTDNVSHTAIYTITQEMGSDSGEDPDNPGGGSGDDDITINTPEIILYKTRLDYTATGGTGYVQVDYKNATTVLEPTCTQSWVTIEKTQAGTTSDGTLQRQYRITLPSTTITRNASIKFSCTNNVGTVFEQNKLMVYQTGPTTDDVEGDSYILVPKPEITLKEIGESEEIVITYANVADIVAPDVPEGYEITEISRTQIDGNTIEVKYRITKIEESNEDVKVIFKAQGKGGSEVSNNTTIKGWTPPTEPATVTIPSISFNDNGYLEFDYTGGTKTITMSIDGYTKPITVTYTINDTNNNITITRSEMDYDDGYDYGVWDFDITSAGNNGSEAITGTIEIHYVDGLTDKTLTVPFYVRYADEGLISVSSGEFKFDKDGNLLTNYDYIGVSILNITSLNTPTCPDWVTIGEGVEQEGVFYGIDARYNYPISVAANDGVERKGIVTFTGLGKDGKTYTDTATVIQEGTDTEIIIDEGFIELQSLSITLPAEGGSDTFQVKYYDAAEIQMPELENTWATIEEVGSTEENGTAWNGTECVVTTKTYRVTAQSTTSGRVMKVICRMTSNENVYFEKDKFRINQLAPGSDGIQGYVYAFNSKITIDAYGNANGDTVWTEARVGYKDVTIEYPTISADWITIDRVVDKGSSKEYDYIKYYDLKYAENESNVSRQATVTFIGINENGTQSKAVVTIIQSGAEDPNIDDGGKYKNYRGYFRSLKGVLYSISFITDQSSSAFGDMVLAGESPVIVSYSEADRLYEPLRTSTCTVSVVSSSYFMELYTGKAQGTQVILKNETDGTIEWCGFLQPNLYNQGFSEPVETIEFEASDCISVLQYFDYEDHFVNGRFMVSFKEIIDDIMDRSKLIKSYYLTDKTFSDSFQSRPMKFDYFNISENNFFSEEGEPWKLQEVLEEICKYMGLVCFQWGDSVYFIDYDMYRANKTMTGYKWNKSDYWNITENVIICDGANEIDVNSYMGTGADMSLDDVFNKVTVNCNYYNIESLIPDIFEDDLLTNRFGDNAIISIPRYGGRGNSTLINKTFYRVYDHKNINSLYYLPIVDENIHETLANPTDSDFTNRFFFRNFIGGNIIDMVHLNYDDVSGKPGESKDFERYLMISQLNRPWCAGMKPYQGYQAWEDYNFPIMEFKDLPVIYIDNSAEGEIERVPTTTTRPSASNTSSNRQYPHRPVPNYLIINAQCVFTTTLTSEFYDGNTNREATDGYDQIRNEPALTFYLEIPQKGWWNGSGWVDYKTHFEVPLEYFGGEKDAKKWNESVWGEEKSVKNNVEAYLFLGTTGYRIPLPSVMDTTRDIYFAIGMPKRFAHALLNNGGDDTSGLGNAYCFIKNLELNIVNRNTIFFEDEDEIFENIIDEGNVIEGEEIELKITSDNYRTISLSTVSTRTAEDVATTDIKFYNKSYELLLPEEAIIERYVNQYSTPSIKTNVTLDLTFKPNQIITDTYWNKDFVITGQEIDYQYDSQTITLLEKK